jgi:Glycosyl hydrolases family 38 N-terminal domain
VDDPTLETYNVVERVTKFREWIDDQKTHYKS